jgi:hypothetical protein
MSLEPLERALRIAGRAECSRHVVGRHIPIGACDKLLHDRRRDGDKHEKLQDRGHRCKVG